MFCSGLNRPLRQDCSCLSLVGLVRLLVWTLLLKVRSKIPQLVDVLSIGGGSLGGTLSLVTLVLLVTLLLDRLLRSIRVRCLLRACLRSCLGSVLVLLFRLLLRDRPLFDLGLGLVALLVLLRLGRLGLLFSRLLQLRLVTIWCVMWVKVVRLFSVSVVLLRVVFVRRLIKGCYRLVMRRVFVGSMCFAVVRCTRQFVVTVSGVLVGVPTRLQFP